MLLIWNKHDFLSTKAKQCTYDETERMLMKSGGPEEGNTWLKKKYFLY